MACGGLLDVPIFMALGSSPSATTSRWCSRSTGAGAPTSASTCSAGGRAPCRSALASSGISG
eukprot:1309976-Lingulodinium_polyedra.AAC.1